MTREIELKLLKEIEELKKEVILLKNNKPIKNEKVVNYNFSNIKYKTLDKLVTIKQKPSSNKFNNWFDYKYKFKKNTIRFFKKLIAENDEFILSYHEEDLKSNFIIPFLNKVKFKDIDMEISSFYHRSLTYKTKNFILNGYCDFYVAKGLFRPEKPYFFIQEFKQDKYTSHPEPQLIAELISAVELTNLKLIRGAYIIGNIWRFVILKKLAKHNYQYYISHNFDCMKLKEIKAIYKNLLFVKDEIIRLEQHKK